MAGDFHGGRDDPIKAAEWGPGEAAVTKWVNMVENRDGTPDGTSRG